MAHFNPFPGLRPFDSSEDYLFFGRDGQTDELLRGLSSNRFLAVIGTSGSGKSSLVRAGLLPALYGGFMLNAGSTWRIALFRPGTDPIGNLASALGQSSVLALNTRDTSVPNKLSETTLRRSSLGLVDLVSHARMPAHDNLLIVVDQFEEIFRFKQSATNERSEDDAASFVRLLLEATRQTEVPIYVAITMRSDFLGDCAQFRDLPEAINDGQYLIPRMTRDQRRAAITGPIAVGGAEITSRLVNRLLNDVGDNPDQLPILQHALMRTWQRWDPGDGLRSPMDFEHYEAVGTMAQALSQHADKAYNTLPDVRHQKIAEKLFKCLTERGLDNREVRRPTKLEKICAIAGATEQEVVEVIEAFRRPGRSFLMPPASVALTGETLIDISHESLIRGWDRLKTWVEEEAASARTYLRLADHAVLHREGKGALWRDPNLRIALDWRDENNPNEDWAERYDPNFAGAMQFLEESKDQSEAEIAAVERQQRREIRRARVFALILACAFLISTAFAFVAYAQRHRAKVSELNAKESMLFAQNQVKLKQEGLEREQRSNEELVLVNKQLSEEKTAAEKLRTIADERRQEAEAEAGRRLIAEQRATRSAQLAEQQTRIAQDSRAAALNVAVTTSKQNIESNNIIVRLVDKLMEVSPPSETLALREARARALSSLGRHSEVVEEYTKILEMEPGYPTALMNRGYTYTVVTDDPRAGEKSLQDLDNYLALDKNSFLAYQNKAIALGQMKDYKGAESAITKAIEVFKRRSSETFSDSDISQEIYLATGFKVIVADEPDLLTALQYHRASLQTFQGQSQFIETLKQTDDKRPKSSGAYLSALNWAWLHMKKRPEDYGGWVSQGALWERAGYPREAMNAYQTFRKKYSDQPDGRYRELAKWVDRAVKNPELLRRQALQSGSNEEDVRILQLRAKAWEEEEELIYAEALLTQALNQDSENVDLLLQRAKVRNRLKRFPESGADADKALLLAPDSPMVLLYRGLATGDLEARKADFRRILDYHPLQLDALFRLSEMEEKTNPEEALKLIERALNAEPTFALSHYRKALLLRKRGDHEMALKSIQKAIMLDKSNQTFYDERAKIEEELERDEAAVIFDKATGYRDAAAAKLKQGERDDALEAYKQSLFILSGSSTRDDPNVRARMTATMHEIAGLAERREGSKAKAIEYLKEQFGDRPELAAILKIEIDRLSSP